MPTLQELKAFVARLKAHDWWYEYSDSQCVWRNGFNDWNAINALANAQPLFKKVLTAYSNHRQDYGNAELHKAFINAVSDAAIEIQGAELIQQDEHTY